MLIKSPRFYPGAEDNGYVRLSFLTAANTIAAVHALIACAAAYGNMSAGITGRCITLHIFIGGVHGIHSTVC